MKRLRKLQESLPTEDFTPRDYQLDLLESARRENTVAAVGSDGGKSFLALTLLRELDQSNKAVKDSYGRARKIAFIAVETAEIAEEYVRAVEDHTDFVAGRLTSIPPEGLKQLDVVVALHEELIALIANRSIDLQTVGLVAIDECTIAVTKYPYSQLFHQDFLVNGSRELDGGMRVLALTSSLLTKDAVSDSVVLDSAVAHLEDVFRSRLKTSVSLISIDRFGYPKEVQIIPYSLQVKPELEEGTNFVKRKLQELLKFLQQCIHVSTLTKVEKADCIMNVNAYNVFQVSASETLECLRVLGLWPTYRLVNIIARDFRNTQLKNLMEQRIMRILVAVTCRFQEIAIGLEKMYGFDKIEKGDLRILDFVSEKLRLLVGKMDLYDPKNPDEGKPYFPVQYFSMIINLSRPYLAWAVSRFLRDLKSSDKQCKYGFVTSAYCLGSFNSSYVTPTDACFFGMPFQVQEEILRRFRNRDFNVLVSTCTNDTTLDVPPCTFCIQFDPVKDYLTFVHARHRTKSKYGTLCLLVENEEEKQYLSEHASRFERIDATVLTRCPDHIVHSAAVPPEVHSLPPEALEPVRAASTGVQIMFSQAIGVINRYCSNLPSDAFANLTPLSYIKEVSQSDGTVWYQCKLTLPINAPMKNAIMGLVMPTRQCARQSAALEACRQLYLLGELDESLAPVSKDTWKTEITKFVALEPPENVPEGEPKPGTTKRRQYYVKKIPAALQNSLPFMGRTCFLYGLEMKLTCPVPQEQNVRGRKIQHPEDALRVFGILATKAIPDIPNFNIYDRSGEIRVSLTEIARDVPVPDGGTELANGFHCMIFSRVLALEKYSIKFSPGYASSQFLIVPLCRESSGYVVDWDYLKVVSQTNVMEVLSVLDEDRQPFDEEVFSDAVIMPWYRSIDQPQTFYVEQICPWLTVQCEFPDSEFPTFGDYYKAKYNITIQHPDQPLLDVDHTSTRLNLLLPRFLSRKGSSLTQVEKKELLKDKESRHRQILVPELCKVHPVSASLWRQAICLPSVLHRIESLLVMEELLQMIKEGTGIGTKATTKSPTKTWPLLDYGWNFEEKVQALGTDQSERDDLDIRNASIIENARLKHEKTTRSKKQTINTWSSPDVKDPDYFEIGNWTSDQSGFVVDTWNPNAIEPQSDTSMSFFDHVNDTYGNMSNVTGSSSKLSDSLLGDSSRVQLKDGSVDTSYTNGVEDAEWGYGAAGDLPGISLVSGFPSSIMKEIEKDLTNFDDSGMTGETSDAADDMETIADSMMTALPIYNLEALDPLKDREEEDFGPVMSSILHLRFSESAPDDFPVRGSADVFENMSDFSLGDPGTDKGKMNSEKAKDSRAEFGEVLRAKTSVTVDRTATKTKQPVVLLEPAIKFDDDREPAFVAGPDPGLLLQAFTSSNANDGINLERLETIGDSFLKFSMTTFLYFRYSAYHEGKLSFLRSLQVSNYNLYRLGFRKGFGEILLSTKFEPTENWLPPCFALSENTDSPNLRTQHCVSDKTLADSVESLIGAYLVSSGIKAAQLLMSWLGLTVLPERLDAQNEECMLSRYTWFPRPSTVLLGNTPEDFQELERLLNGYEKFEDRIGYKFRDRSYLLQAFTHASYTYNRVTDCYQRLEFLGDAVLDYLITRHLFEDLRGHSPGALTDLRSALVNNAIFASMAVRYEFHKYVKLLSPAIFHLVEKYVKEQRERDHSVTIFSEDIYFYDPAVDEDMLEDDGGAEETECPKVLGDVFESVAGAIYLDSGMSLDAVWRVYYTMMKSEIEQCSTNIPKSPVRELLELEPENVKFSIPERTAAGKIRVVVEIFDKGKFVGLGRNYRTAKCTAAKQALKYLRSLEDRAA